MVIFADPVSPVMLKGVPVLSKSLESSGALKLNCLSTTVPVVPALVFNLYCPNAAFKISEPPQAQGSSPVSALLLIFAT